MATASFTTAQLVALSTDQVAALSTEIIRDLSTAQVRAFTTVQIPALTTEQIQALTTNQLPVLTTAQLKAIQTEDVVALTTDQVKVLTTAQVAALTTDQVVALETGDFAALQTRQVAALTTAQVSKLTTDQIKALTTEQVTGLTTAQVRSLTTDQIQALETADFQALNTRQLGGLTTAQFGALTTEQFKALETGDIRSLTTASIAVLSTEIIKALTTEQVKGFTTAQIRVLTTDQISALETADIASLSSSQTAAFTSAQIRVMATDQINALNDAATPLVLDLNGDGVRTLGVADGVGFDIQAIGRTRQTGWAAPTDGLLVRDINRDGAINDGRELFGSGTQLADGVTADDGFQALRALDDNGDGQITSADALFSELAVWTDADRDGHTDAGELRSLTDHGIVALNLSAQTSNVVDNGNLLGLVSSYETADGTTRDLVDVWFRQGAVLGDELRTSVSSLTETLGSYVQNQDLTGMPATQASDMLQDPQAPGRTSLASTASMANPMQGLVAQLETYYQLQGPTLAPSGVASGVSAADRLLSHNGVAGLPGQSTVLASNEGGKSGK